MNYININRRSGILTISSVFLLLIAGGVVRSTGSGMGCPDWPKCYGAWAPPTCVCELPSDYQDIYVQKRIKKAERFAKLLSSIGLKDQATQILNDPNLHTPEEFNVRKAWTEYINRLIGVLSGLFALVFFLSLIKARKYITRFRFWMGVLGFIMMLFNAWLGSIVVATNLFPVIISIHYLAAYAVIVLFMLSLVHARIMEDSLPVLKFKWYFVLMLVVSLVQLVYGTQLREVSDTAISNGVLYKADGVNFEALGITFKIHWVIAVLLIGMSIIPVITLRKKIKRKWYLWTSMISVVLLVQYISGVLNLRYQFPLLAQVSHIFFAGVIFGITLYICIAIFRSPKTID